MERAPAWAWLCGELIGLVRQFGGTVIGAGVGIYLIHETAATVQAFAGRTSIANLLLDVAAHANVTVIGSVSLTGVTGVLWFLELRRHRKTRERLTGRVAQLELQIDPNRSSSELTTLGTTRLRDL